jgi:hypothetical protein
MEFNPIEAAGMAGALPSEEGRPDSLDEINWANIKTSFEEAIAKLKLAVETDPSLKGRIARNIRDYVKNNITLQSDLIPPIKYQLITNLGAFLVRYHFPELADEITLASAGLCLLSSERMAKKLKSLRKGVKIKLPNGG